MKPFRLIYLGVIMIVLAACQAQSQSPEELARTMVAQTSEAASPTPRPSRTPAPSDTPVPTETSTATPLPTDTPSATPTPTEVPSLTPTATATPPPTNTPTLTRTPGPLTFTDDFSTKNTAAWSGCSAPDCQWADGVLQVGPYDAGGDADMHIVTCEACGEATYYKMSVDATFIDGYNDRWFGIVFNMNDEYHNALEVVTLVQFCAIWKYDVAGRFWELENQSRETIWNGMVKPGYATNRLGVEVHPTNQPGKADFFIKLNDRTSFVVYTRPVKPGKVGFVVDMFAMEIHYDNFVFEEIEP